MFSESGKEFEREKLSSEAQAILARAERIGKSEFKVDPEIKKIMEGDGIKASYKIEILFGPDRTIMGPNKFLMSIWESGKRFHGGGDDLMYWCKDVRTKASWENSPGCGNFIPSSTIVSGVALCPHCVMPIDTKFLTGHRAFNLPTGKITEVVARTFRTLKMNADIYCKYHYTDIRYKAMEKAKGLEVARRLRGMHIYPLARIMKDTSVGANLDGRIKAFLTA